MTHATDTISDRGRFPFDYEGADTVSMAVVFAAAAAAGVDPIEAPPLADVINPRCLNKLFAGTVADDRVEPARLSFRYLGSRVTIDGGGWICVDRSGDRDADAGEHEGRPPEEPTGAGRAPSGSGPPSR